MTDPMLAYHRQFAAFCDELFDSMIQRRPIRFPAQGIEAGTAETGTGSVHESAVGSADAPKGDLS